MKNVAISLCVLLVAIAAVYFLSNPQIEIVSEKESDLYSHSDENFLKSENSEVAPGTDIQTMSDTTPTIAVVGYKAEGPAVVDLVYTNLIPGVQYGVTLCVETGGCLEWVESFIPIEANGSYQMDVRHGYAESKMELGSGKMRPMLFRESFGNEAIYGEYFAVISGSDLQ